MAGGSGTATPAPLTDSVWAQLEALTRKAGYKVSVAPGQSTYKVDQKLSVTVNGEAKPRVRSMSMNVYLGGWGGTYGNWDTVMGAVWSDFKIYRKQADLSDPGPSSLFVFLDMRQDSIDMGNFATDMDGWPRNSAHYGFFDLPGSWHHRACGFSFADGHSEIRRWRDDRTMPAVVQQGFVNDWLLSPDNQDVAWLQERATRPK